MKTEIKNIDEVVFENRNQNYGAFYLRRSYNKNVARALLIAILSFLGLISIPLIASRMHREVKATIETVYETFLPAPDKNDIEEVKKQDVKPADRIQAFTPPVIVNDTESVTDDFIDIMDHTDDHAVIGDIDTTLIVPDHQKDKAIDPPPDKPFINVEIMPEFKGGEPALFEWLGRNVKYPEIAKEANITGTVIVTFVVEKDGNISNIVLLKDIGGNCGDEALKAVKVMPKWNEGRQNGVPVRVQFILPIKFTLE